MTIKSTDDAAKIYLEKNPGMKILYVLDYDPDTYVILAIDKNKESADIDDQHFSISKRNGGIQAFYPMSDLDGFEDALSNRCVIFKREVEHNGT